MNISSENDEGGSPRYPHSNPADRYLESRLSSRASIILCNWLRSTAASRFAIRQRRYRVADSGDWRYRPLNYKGVDGFTAFLL